MPLRGIEVAGFMEGSMSTSFPVVPDGIKSLYAQAAALSNIESLAVVSSGPFLFEKGRLVTKVPKGMRVTGTVRAGHYALLPALEAVMKAIYDNRLTEQVIEELARISHQYLEAIEDAARTRERPLDISSLFESVLTH